MKIIIESTSKIVHLGTTPARIWEGHTLSGIPVHCFVTRIATDATGNLAQFEAELQEQKPPSAEVEAIPLRLIL